MTEPTSNIATDNFIVVQVDQDFDHIDGVYHMGDFTTRKEAYQYIVNRLGTQNSLWNARWDYIDKWVDAIEVPEMDYKEWLEYLKRYKLSGSTWTPKNFKESLISYLKSSYSIDIEGYNPPHADFGSNNLFIVEKTI